MSKTDYLDSAKQWWTNATKCLVARTCDNAHVESRRSLAIARTRSARQSTSEGVGRMKHCFQIGLLVVLASLLSSCSKKTSNNSETEQVGARQPVDKLAIDTARKNAAEAEPLVNAGHELWRSGRHGEAIEKYSEAMGVDTSNPYSHFGFGMQEAQEGGLLPAANGSLYFYLE